MHGIPDNYTRKRKSIVLTCFVLEANSKPASSTPSLFRTVHQAQKILTAMWLGQSAMLAPSHVCPITKVLPSRHFAFSGCLLAR